MSSVRKKDQSEHRFTVLDKCLDLYDHTTAVTANPKKVKHERKKIKRMVAMVQKGKLTKRDVDRHFKAYKASVSYGNSHNLIYRLNRWYESLWKGA